MRFAIVLMIIAMVVYTSTACNGGCEKSKGLLDHGGLTGTILKSGGGMGGGSKRGCSTCGGNIDNVSTTTSGSGINVRPAIEIL